MSHEAIYRSLFIQARGALKKELNTGRDVQRTDPGEVAPLAEIAGRLEALATS